MIHKKIKMLTDDWFKCTLRLQDKLNSLLRALKKKLSNNLFDFLFASGSSPGIWYGLPKVHKNGCPVTDFVSFRHFKL